MGQVVVLGSASAVPTLDQENTHLLIQVADRTILVDCPGNPLVRMKQGGYDPQSITDIILTHFHPDHVAGLAPLLMDLWLMGRRKPMTVYGLDATIDRAQTMMELYDWGDWPNFYPVHFVRVPSEPLAPVIEADSVRVLASPVDHLIPTIGLRFEFLAAGKVLAYSCDTEPSAAVEKLAHNADYLIHEATGASKGHTAPKQAGEVARRAGVKTLYLIHYPPQLDNHEQLLAEARQSFGGQVLLATDFLKIQME